MSATNQKSLAVIVGGGAIARALAEQLAADSALSVYVLSRSELVQSGVETFETDYTDASLARIAAEIGATELSLSRLVVTNGLLSSESIRPERKVSDLDEKRLVRACRLMLCFPCARSRPFGR